MFSRRSSDCSEGLSRSPVGVLQDELTGDTVAIKKIELCWLAYFSTCTVPTSGVKKRLSKEIRELHDFFFGQNFRIQLRFSFCFGVFDSFFRCLTLFGRGVPSMTSPLRSERCES